MLIENGVRFFWALSTLLLSLTYAAVWFRFSLVQTFPSLNAMQIHYMTAIPCTLLQFFTALGVLFYFIGTGVWIKDQAMGLAKKDRKKAEAVYEIYKKANKLKGQAFPFVTFAIFFGIMTFVLGGARQVEAIPNWIHPTIASLFVLISVVSMPFIFPAIKRNIAYLDEASKLLETP